MNLRLKALSPSAFDLYESNRDEFYMKYCAAVRAPRLPQTPAMSVGSAFDARVKSFLNEHLELGIEAFGFQNLLATQVEQHNLEFAVQAGQHVFDEYKKCGALADLIADLKSIDGHPRLESTVQGLVNGVPMLGKPDIYYRLQSGGRVITDWKVNGYCSKSAKSPAPGFLCIRDSEYSSKHGTSHKDCMPKMHGGVMVNGARNMEAVDLKWAAQLAIYAWLLGEPVGGDFVVGIDQIVAKPGLGKPILRTAKHRCLISESFQLDLFDRMQACWMRLQEGIVFDEDNDLRCSAAEEVAKSLYGAAPGSADEWFNEMAREE